ncbi:hypothetical protein PoB_007635800 [Plakobranchus ocellatus]|uniref:RNase H type-1 domain-containing protein n=1 Tax=Plakobranchus ocellatus TaxID=259542 RepID=A0AAV4E0G0_9GAST|nr:hypothetical protein PoB_007635800 [Plakobranchus ocellatus]
MRRRKKEKKRQTHRKRYMANGGYGIYFLWADGSTTRICGPVGERTSSYDSGLRAVTECLRVMIEKQLEGAELLGVVIFTDCRLADYLQ